MKEFLCLAIFSFCIFAARVDLAAVPPKSETATYSVGERGANHRVWNRVTLETNAFGKILARTNSYTELASGLCRKDPQTDKWIDADPEIVVAPDGKGLAQNAQHSIRFQPNINTFGAIELTTPTGKTLRSHLIAIYYHDWKTDLSVQLDGLKESIGNVVGQDQVIYNDIFAGVKADVRYTFRKSGMSQDVIFQEQLPSPSDFKLDPATTEIEIWTEFIDPPLPKILSVDDDTLKRKVIQSLDFGDMRIGQGTAFNAGEEQQRNRGTPVKKDWVTLQGRTFLIESVNYANIGAQLEQLPARQQAQNSRLKTEHLAAKGRIAPAALAAKAVTSGKLQVASIIPEKRGFVVDYETVSTQPEFTFEANTTYYVDDSVFLSGNTVIESGAVIKFANSTTASISVESVECRTVSHLPAIFTSMDDDSVGDMIIGSTGDPWADYSGGDIAFVCQMGSLLHDVRFSHLKGAVGAPTELTAKNFQIVHCQSAFVGGVCFYLHNGLINGVETAFYFVEDEKGGWGGQSVYGEQLTIDGCGNFIVDITSDVRLTNSVVAATANLYDCLFVTLDHTEVVDYWSPYIDAGNTTADQVGLYHYAIQSDQAMERDSVVDLGFHYLALGGDGLPLDAGQNGIPDYLEDLNGNGVVDAGENDFIPPTISITAPLNAASFSVARVNVSGTFVDSSIKRITVNGVLAFISGNTFQALNVSLQSGANTITATAEDLGDNTPATASITITATPDGSGNLIDPVQLSATPVGGFAPLTVTFTPSSAAPGTLQEVQYDFNGDGIIDQTESSLSPIPPHLYSTAGEYFPVVTVQTTVGKFSSTGGWNTFEHLRINVQTPPVQLDSISITDPVDLKATANGHLYVLSRSAASITEYDESLTPVRSITGIGAAPRGIDVDSAGNVYVAMTGDNQVWKFTPITTSFQPDTTFNTSGHIGTAGTGNGQFNAPFDVAVIPDGEEIAVSDSGNHRIQRFTKNGVFINSFGQSGSGFGQFSTPKGLTYDDLGVLYVVDAGNNRIVTADGVAVLANHAGTGTGLGQLQGPINIAINGRGIYASDTGNNRIQKFDSSRSIFFDALCAVSTGLNSPESVAGVEDFLEERIWIADTGNDRVVLVKLLASNPETTWVNMKVQLTAWNVEGAISYFSSSSADKYRQAFLTIGQAALVPVINQIPALIPVFIEGDQAQYRFQQVVEGITLDFPVDFVLENGIWKILEY